MLEDFLKGIKYFLHGFSLIRQPSLRRFVWVPLLCNLILFVILIFFAAYGLDHFSRWVAHTLPSSLQWLRWVVFVSSLLFSGIALLFISTFLVNLIAAPFNSLLAEKVIHYLKVEQKPLDISMMKAIPLGISRQMNFLFYYFPRAIVYLILFIVPLVQIIATFLWFLFNSWVFTMQYLDYPMDLYGVSMKQMRELMVKKRGVCLGFGSGILLFAMVPLVNFIVVPVSVVGATLLFTKEFKNAYAMR